RRPATTIPRGSVAARRLRGSYRRKDMGAAWQIATIRGIPIRLHWSLLLVFSLLTVSLATAYLPGTEPDLGTGAAWGLAIVSSVLFFVSLLLHELGHSIVAMRAGLPVDSITLFIFG